MSAMPPVDEPAGQPGGERSGRTGSASSLPPAPRQRGCVGTMVSGGFGCLAFLVGAALAIAIAAPQLLAGWAARALQQHVSGMVDAEVIIGELELRWNGRQRADNVILRDDHNELVTGNVRFPSLLDLLVRPEEEWTVFVTNLKVHALVDADGTSDLGRALRLDPSGSTTELEALRDAVGGWLARSSGQESTRSVSLNVQLDSAEFRPRVDPEGGEAAQLEGRRFARVNELHLTLDASRVGCGFEITDAFVTGSDLLGEASVNVSARFGEGAGTGLQLQSASLTVGKIPLATLALLGVVDRPGSGEESADGADPGPGAVERAGARALKPLFESGVDVAAHYWPAPSRAADDMSIEVTSAHPVVTFDLVSDAGELHFHGVHEESQLVARALRGEADSLDARFRLPHGVLTELVRTFIPSGLDIEEPDDGTAWSVRSRELVWPLSPSSLELGALLQDASEGQAPERSSLIQRLARVAATCDGRLYLPSPAASSATLIVQPSKAADQGELDRLVASHALTTIDLTGELGSHLTSNWKVGDGSAGLARFDVAFPGAQLGLVDRPGARLDLSVPMVSKKMLHAVVPLPDEIYQLLTYRIQRLSLKGLSLGAPSEGAPRPIAVSMVIDDEDRIDGVYRDGVFKVPKAQFSMPLDEDSCDLILKRFMPWFIEVSAENPGLDDTGETEQDRVLTLFLEGLEFQVVSGEFRQKGRVEVRADTVWVQLHPDIASKFTVSDEDDDGWIEWTPAPTVLVLEPSMVRYTQLEIPFGDSYAVPFEGVLDRLQGHCRVDGYVDSDILAQSEGPALPVGLGLKLRDIDGIMTVNVYTEIGAVSKGVQEILDKALAPTKPK